MRTVGIGSVAAGSLDGYVQVVRGSVYRTGLHTDRAPGDVGVDVRCYDRAYFLLQHTFSDDQIRPRRVSFLARLEEGGERLR